MKEITNSPELLARISEYYLAATLIEVFILSVAIFITYKLLKKLISEINSYPREELDLDERIVLVVILSIVTVLCVGLSIADIMGHIRCIYLPSLCPL